MPYQLARLLEPSSIRIACVPADALNRIREELESLQRDSQLNPFQEWILKEGYVLSLPALDFAPQSLLVAVCPLTLYDVVYCHGGKRLTDLTDVSTIPIEERVTQAAASLGYRAHALEWLPVKRLVACSGLGAYGRNNLIYAGDWGSFCYLAAFASDMPPDDDAWGEMAGLKRCARCGKCVHACPTHAILPERFLLNNERCITYLAETGTEPFPAWVPKGVPHHLTGCMVCQRVCPENEAALARPRQEMIFDENETGLLLSGPSREMLPPSLEKKLSQLGLLWILPSLARNLKAMFDALEA